MKIRPKRELLVEAMREVREIDPTEKAVRDFFYILYGDKEFLKGELKVEPYGYDDRIAWDTYIVTINGSAIGFTDGSIESHILNGLEG